MKPIYKLMIEPRGSRYNNEIDVNGKSLIMNANIDEKDFSFTNRIGIVLGTPVIDTPFNIGDEVIVHHNVFRKYWGFNNKLKTSSSDIQDNKFMVPLDQVFAYRSNVEDEWVCVNDSIFVQPIESVTEGIIYEMDKTINRIGKYLYGNINGLKYGDTVTFEPNCNYEFNIDGVRMYKMRNRNITCKLTEV